MKRYGKDLVIGVDCAAFKKYQVQTKEWMEFQEENHLVIYINFANVLD